jgi:diguanylate cyclase (GGDEF)-like protein
MLSIPTLWLVFVVNFLALALVWTYVSRSYPNFGAARYWAAGAYFACAGAALSMLRGSINELVTIVIGGGLMIYSCWLGAMGVQRFYGRRASWPLSFGITALSTMALVAFKLWHDDMAMRIFSYSMGQSLALALMFGVARSERQARGNPGARLAATVAVLGMAIHAVRSAAAVARFGGDVSFLDFNGFQAAMVVGLVFLSMVWNFGFLLMAIDRLRAEVAVLALVDDLTGIANRRHLLQRLAEECALSQRTNEPFALLAIDLDGFKEINDDHGHGAGDECLRLFTGAAQSRLRPGDMLARAGGDEFCIVLPATTLREAAGIARHVLDACRETFARWEGTAIPIAASVGVAQWSPAIGAYPERLIAAADQALYAAKKEGKNRHAVHEAAPPLVPGMADGGIRPAQLERTP